MLIENALSPAKVISVIADAEEKTAKVVVPDYQLSLAIGKEGQNARLAARLTGFKIDIKSETQARESGDFMDYENDYEDSYRNSDMCHACRLWIRFYSARNSICTDRQSGADRIIGQCIN